MEQDATAAMPVIDSGEKKDGKGWKIATVIASVVAVCGVGFGVYGMMQGTQESPDSAYKDNQGGVVLIRPLADIDQWEVKSLIIDDATVYQSSGNTYITDDQEDGWSILLKEIGIVCHTRDPKIQSGSTAHTNITINMKNGNTYNLVHLGNQNQVDITTPDGMTTKYQCYYDL